MQKLGGCLLRLSRLNRPIPTFTLLWPGLSGLALAGPIELSNALLFGMGSVVMRGVADTVNDMVDADVDRQVTRTKDRPMATGELSEGKALIFVAAQLGVASLLYAQLARPAQLLAALSLIPIAVYPYAKRCIRLPQISLATTINLALPIAWCHSANCSVFNIPYSIQLFYVGFMCWTLVYDTA